MVIRFLRLTVAVLLFLCGHAYLWADMAPVRSVGYTIRPIQETSVRMVSEKVEITLNDSLAFVSSRFDMKNEGNAKNLLVGFPRDFENDLLDFRAWVDGKEIPVTYIDPIPENKLIGKRQPPFAVTFTVPFGSSGKTVTVINKYRSRIMPDVLYKSLFPMEDFGFTYFLETGASWKDTIGEAVVTVDFGSMPPGRITAISPSGYTKKGYTASWRFVNFEPSMNDRIEIRLIQKIIYERMVEAQALLAKNPNSARAHYLLGTVKYNRTTVGHSSDEHRWMAETEFIKAVELDPGMLDARYFLAVLHLSGTRSGVRPYSAIDQLREIIKRDPDYACRDKAYPALALRNLGVPDTRASSLLASCEKWAGTSR